ncbi:MAG: hypothetical protein EOO92_25270 [Pedobacter sp.]|nr:MAG: hypothetical protein EOO92_25270 [Pedobacter sp.]
MKKFNYTLILALLLCFSLSAQVKVDSVKTDPSLQGQYQLMLAKSKTLNGYKLVNPYRLSQVWQSVKDTLKTERKNLKEARAKIATLESGVSNLKKEITGTETSLAATNAKMDEISFIGISFTKGNYNILVWTIIILLGLALTIVILRSAKNIHEAKYRTSLYDEISQEYQTYKTKANEKEKKLARELQDERNRIEEMKGRG